MRPGPLVLAAVVLAVAGTYLAGIAAEIPLWLVALALAALGIGIANTASLGLLVDAVPVERVATAMVVWSQIGILGYLLGPLTGGIVAHSLGYAFGRGPRSGRRSRRLPPSHFPLAGKWAAGRHSSGQLGPQGGRRPSSSRLFLSLCFLPSVSLYGFLP